MKRMGAFIYKMLHEQEFAMSRFLPLHLEHLTNDF